MPKPVLRGLIIVAFFALSAFVLVPLYVPRPAFIPGFAPPPDMWPRTVSLAGILLGALALLFAFTRGAPAEEPVETDGSSKARMSARFAGLMLAFVLFLVAIPLLGFLVSSVLLTLCIVLMTGERGHHVWIALLAFGGPILLQMFFHSALGTQFPKGVLTKPFGF